MLKYLAFIVILTISTEVFGGNRVFIKEIDASALPQMQASFYSFTDSFTPDELIAQDLILNDNGEIIEIQLSNPVQEIDETINLLVLVDLAVDTNIVQLDSIKALITTIRNELTDGSQVALMTFDEKCYLNADFDELFDESLNQLFIEERSVLDSAFLSDKLNPSTILSTLNNLKILLITSHLTGPQQVTEIQNQLSQNQIEVTAVNFNDFVNIELKNLVEATGGDYIKVDSDLSNYLSRIYSALYNYQSSTISWISNRDCISEHSVTLSLKDTDAYETTSYFLPDSIKPELISEPFDKKFTNVLPGSIDSVDFFLKATNDEILISNIELSNDYDGVFQLLGSLDSDVERPVLIPQGGEYPLRLFFNPTDSSIVFTRILIESDACFGNEIKITGGFPNTPPKNNTIEVVYPNCGENLAVGEQIDVEWTGLLPRDVIQLEYSIDNGANWDTLAKNVLNLKYPWTVPNLPSDECLVRAIQLWPNNIGRTIDLRHGEDVDVNMAKFNKDGSLVVSSADDRIIRIWNANTAELIAELEGHTDNVVTVEFSPNEEYIISAGRDGEAILWYANPESPFFGDSLRHYSDHTRGLFSARFDAQGNRIITSSSDGNYIIYSTANKTPIHIGNTNTSQTRYATFAPDGSSYAVANNRGIVTVFNSQNHSIIKEIDTGLDLTSGPCSYIDYSPDSKIIATVNDNLKYISVWDLNEDEPKYNFVHVPFYQDDNSKLYIPTHCSFFYSEQDTFLLSSANNATIQWDLSTGDSLNTFLEHESRVSSAYYNFDGVRVLTSSWDGLVKIWNLQERDLQMDTSDCVFSIIIPEIQVSDVDFGDVLIGQSEEVEISNFITNITDATFEIKQMVLRGRDRQEFRLLQDYTGRIIVGNEELKLNVIFDPKSVGVKQAFIDIIIPNDTITASIIGNVVEKDLNLTSSVIEFDNTEIDEQSFYNNQSLFVNSSVSNITIDSAFIYYPNKSVFEITDNLAERVIAPGASAGLDLIFAPDTIDFYNASVKVFHDGNIKSSKILLLGNGVKPRIDTVTFELKDITGQMGEIINSGIYIKNVSELGINEVINSFSTKISFNATMLEPLFEFNSSELNGDIRTLSLSIPIQDREDYLLNEETLVYDLPFKSLLGNDTISTIDIHETIPDQSAKILINENDAEFVFTSFCEEGGIRLFEDLGRFELMQNRPNPAYIRTTIEFEVIEIGKSRLYIMNSTGEEIEEIINDAREPGRYQIDIDLSNYPPGLYYYILETPSRTNIKKLLVSEN